jgi:hypothetical protein
MVIWGNNKAVRDRHLTTTRLAWGCENFPEADCMEGNKNESACFLMDSGKGFTFTV